MKRGILLINLGTPNSTSVRDVRNYLREFLSDPRVITLPKLVRLLIVYLFILPFRPKKTAQAYKSIWSNKGSPLMLHSESLTQKLQQKFGQDVVVKLAMRYGEPSLAKIINEFYLHNISELKIIPLFPQYSSAATGSPIEAVLNILKTKPSFPNIKLIQAFYNHPEYIFAQSKLIKSYLNNTNWDHILFSYHGLPENHLDKVEQKPHDCDRRGPCPAIYDNNTNCYRAQCYATTAAIMSNLKLDATQCSTSFQSRLGRTPWIQPYTDEILHELRKNNIKHLAVVCPSFVSDCLETLEEINIALRATWLKLGGLSFTMIPCLNDNSTWVDALYNIIESF